MADSLLAFRELYNIRMGLQILAEDYRDMEEFFYEMRHFPPFRRRFKSRRLHPFMLDTMLTGFSGGASVGPENIKRLVYPHEELKVRRVEYASPGFKDLAGFGDIVGHVKDFTVKMIEYFGSRKNRNLMDEEQELKNQSLRIKNAREFVGLAKECGFEESELRKIVLAVDEKQDPLVALVESGKIQDARMLEEPKDKMKG